MKKAFGNYIRGKHKAYIGNEMEEKRLKTLCHPINLN